MVIKSKDGISRLPISQLLSLVIDEGLEADANFIHLEPINDAIKVKYRIAGSLVVGAEIPKKRFSNLSERIKKLANIQIGYVDLISGGKFKYSFNDQVFSIRVYIVPTINGEKITLKIQNEAPISNTLKELGFWGNSLETLSQAINLKSGLILITGPNDSGKSKTIATLLESVSDHSLNIATLEDPVEYKISRATQTQINYKTNLSFKNGVKVLLKQDNDIIMISELTDFDTINEALGIIAHKKLVVSSLNVSSATEAITRILDYGVDPSSLAHSLRIVVNQRLVRRLCPNCKQYVELDKNTSSKINGLYELNIPKHMQYIHNLELQYKGIESKDKKITAKDLSTTETRIKKVWTNKPDGCTKCLNTGFKGRIAITEIIKNSLEIERLIITKSKDILINRQAVKEGTINYLVDGLLKVLVGETSVDEIINLTK